MQVRRWGRPGNCRADEGSGNRCEDGWGSQVDEWKMAMKGYTVHIKISSIAALKFFNSNLSFQKQCSHYSGECTEHTVFLLMISSVQSSSSGKLLTVRFVDYPPDMTGTLFWKDISVELLLKPSQINFHSLALFWVEAKISENAISKLGRIKLNYLHG